MIGFVGVQQQQQASKVRKDSTAVQHNLLAERASQWLHLINTQQLRAFDTLVAEDATLHVSFMVVCCCCYVVKAARGLCLVTCEQGVK